MTVTTFVGFEGYGGTSLRQKFSWMTIKDGVISEMGRDAAEVQSTGDVIDLSGKHLLPGFVDCHSHLSISAWIPTSLDGSVWSSKSQVLDEIEKAAQGKPNQNWILALLADFDSWSGGLPKPEELDEASGGIPVFLGDLTLHRGLISETGLRRTCLLEQFKHAGDIDYRSGRPTGMIWEEASSYVLGVVLSDFAKAFGEKGVEELFFEEAQRHLSQGITACHDPCIPSALVPSMERLRARTKLRLSWSSVSNETIMTKVDATEVCLSCGEGPRSAKLFMDGAHRCSMCLNPSLVFKMAKAACAAALSGRIGPIADMMRYRTTYQKGNFYMPYLRMAPDDLRDILISLGENDIRARIHALGNHAVSSSVHALKESGLKNASLEHLMVLTERDIDAVAEAGVVASLQPGFIPHYAPPLMDRGIGGDLKILPVRSLQRAGVPLALSSDNPCGPLDPIHNIRCAIERGTQDGRTVDADESLNVLEACCAYSIGGNFAISGKLGAGLSIGAPADFIVLNGLPDREDARVLETWIGGAKAYAA